MLIGERECDGAAAHAEAGDVAACRKSKGIVGLAGQEDRNLPPAQSRALPGWPLLASELGDQG